MGFGAGIWASRLEFVPGRKGTNGEGGEEKISPMCGSIGHRPLLGPCPKRAAAAAPDVPFSTSLCGDEMVRRSVALRAQ